MTCPEREVSKKLAPGKLYAPRSGESRFMKVGEIFQQQETKGRASPLQSKS
jgi:hypothetical protein